jgi:predicted PurR-regulated permease PerM
MAADEPRLDKHDDDIAKGDEWGFSPFTRRVASVLAMTALVVFVFITLWQTFSLLLVLFLGILLALFLRGPTNFLAAHTRISHGWALVLIVSALVVVLGGTGFLLAPSVAEQFAEIGRLLPEAVAQVRQWMESFGLGRRLLAEVDVETLTEWVSAERVGVAFSGIAGALSHALFVIVTGLYLAIDPAVYKRGIVRLTPLRYRGRAEQVLDAVSHQLGWWLIGRLTAMLAVGVLTTIGLWLLGIPLALTLGLLSGLLAFIPIVGPIVAVVPAGLIALLEGPMFVVYVIALYLGVQAIEGYLITPIVQHRAVSLPHALTLIAEVFAGLLFGLIGIIVATPLAVMIMAIVNLVYIEDVLGDTTPMSDKIPGHEERLRPNFHPQREPPAKPA